MTILKGRVLKNYNGYYYVNVSEENKIYTCKVKGKMKKARFSLATGDFVNFELGDKDDGMILEVLPRKNYLMRPIMANLDLFVATFACASPDFSPIIADKLIALAESSDIPIIIVFNKMDLAEERFLENMQATYGSIGYEIFPISAISGEGIETLRERLRGKVCAFGGPSGVGKSSTINAIDHKVALRTGDVSEKIGRGKHTTRFAELLPFDDGYIADTPGFGNLLLEGFESDSVLAGFKEFAKYADDCRFHPCTHTHEPGCAVKNAIGSGEIMKTRHASYLEMLEEVALLNKKQW